MYYPGYPGYPSYPYYGNQDGNGTNWLWIIIIIAIIASTAIIANKIKTEKRKYEIEQINEYKYFISKENEKYGVINTNGETIIETK